MSPLAVTGAPSFRASASYFTYRFVLKRVLSDEYPRTVCTMMATFQTLVGMRTFVGVASWLARRRSATRPGGCQALKLSKILAYLASPRTLSKYQDPAGSRIVRSLPCSSLLSPMCLRCVKAKATKQAEARSGFVIVIPWHSFIHGNFRSKGWWSARSARLAQSPA